MATPRKKSSPAGALSLVKRVEKINAWRDQYNPLRNLTLARAVRLVESYIAGDYADLMWTLGAPFVGVESADADMLTLIERRTGALLEMEWDIRTVSEKKFSCYDEALAEEQTAALREAYEHIENLYAGIEHLATATFRGFAHCEIIRNAAGAIASLACVPQWNIVRDGTVGGWKYNPEAKQLGFAHLSEDMRIDPASWLVRETPRPVGRIALIKWIRENLCEKDWDAFLEIVALPSGVVIGPPDVPEEKENEYAASAQEISKGGSGYLPNGAQYVPNELFRGTNPFKERLAHLQEKLILAGTGGLLTSLAKAGGLGDGTANAHADVFASLARKDARQISEVFQRRIDKDVLAEKFPGKPQLAYFAIAADDEEDAASYVDNVIKLATAGYVTDAGEVSEKTGYTLTYQAPQPPMPPMINSRRDAKTQRENLFIQNKDLRASASLRENLLTAITADFAPAKAQIEIFLQKLEAGTATEADVPALADMFACDAVAAQLEKGMLDAVAEAAGNAGGSPAKTPIRNTDQERVPEGQPGGGQFAGDGVPTGPHNLKTKLPPDQRKLTEDQFRSAVKELGFKFEGSVRAVVPGKGYYDPENSAYFYKVADSSGKAHIWTPDDVGMALYGKKAPGRAGKRKQASYSEMVVQNTDQERVPKGSPDGGQFGGSSDASLTPKPISAAEFDSRMTKGEIVTDKAGRKRNFGKELKRKLESAPKYAARKELLDYAQETVRRGTFKQSAQNDKGVLRDYYGKVFPGKGGKSIIVVAEAHGNGDVFNFFECDRNYLKKRGLTNRQVLSRIKQEKALPASLIGAIVAAHYASSNANHA